MTVRHGISPERERLKFERGNGANSYPPMMCEKRWLYGEIVSEELAKLPNILARDAGLKPMAVNRVQSVDLRNQIISRMVK